MSPPSRPRVRGHRSRPVEPWRALDRDWQALAIELAILVAHRHWRLI